MAGCLLCLLLQMSGICAWTEQQAEAPYKGDDSQCTAGLALLQKKSIQKRGIAMESATVEEYTPGEPIERTVHEVGTLLLQQATLQTKARLADDTGDRGAVPGQVTVVLKSEGAPTLASVVLGKYPGYDGALEVQGSVNISVVKKVVGLAWSFTGLEQSCEAASQALRKEMNSTKPNSCGLHIHEGMSCDSHDDVGGHYYHHAQYKEDPWATVVYVANKDGASVGSTTVALGSHFRDIDGRALVVHDHTGGRVACGLLQNVRSGTPPSTSMALLVLVLLLSVFASV